VLVAPVCLYLGGLTLLALVHRPRALPPAKEYRRIAVLIPAHNEQAVLGRLLECLARVSYPRDRLRVCVVADNCTDDTALIATAHGAMVFERQDDELRGKGYALDWLLGRLRERGHPCDACVVLDADSTVSTNFFTAMNAHLAAGAQVVQGYYTVLRLRGSRAELLREASLALVHYLRPCAKSLIGASCGLKGNGMCFDRAVLERFGWPCAGLAEDVEFHLLLVGAGLRVDFAPEAVVYGEMPTTLRAAQSQNTRWEAGRLAAVRRQAWPLLERGVRTRDVVAVDAAVEQLVPPLSVPCAVAGLVFILGLATRTALLWGPAGLMLSIFGAYVITGQLLARVTPRVLLALAYVPVYAAWKVALYVRVLADRGERQWVRTRRADGTDAPRLGR
jgi:hypothetical protein